MTLIERIFKLPDIQFGWQVLLLNINALSCNAHASTNSRLVWKWLSLILIPVVFLNSRKLNLKLT